MLEALNKAIDYWLHSLRERVNVLESKSKEQASLLNDAIKKLSEEVIILRGDHQRLEEVLTEKLKIVVVEAKSTATQVVAENLSAVTQKITQLEFELRGVALGQRMMPVSPGDNARSVIELGPVGTQELPPPPSTSDNC